MLRQKDVRGVEQLARLKLDRKARSKVRHDLEEILDYFSALDEVDTKDVNPMSHGGQLGNVLREDQREPCLPLKRVLQNAPRRRDGYFEVPRVL